MLRRQGHSSRSRSDASTPKQSEAASIPVIARLRLTQTLPPVSNDGSGTTAFVFCPWLKRSPCASDLWTSALAVHDVNGTLLDSLPRSKGQRQRHHTYAAIFAVDGLQPRGELIRRIKDAGIGGVINLPSVSFLDGESAEVFSRLSLGIDTEIDCLETCLKEGLRIGGVVRSVQAAKRLLDIGARFLIVHHGPLSGGRAEVDAGESIAELARHRDTPVFALEELITRDRAL